MQTCWQVELSNMHAATWNTKVGLYYMYVHVHANVQNIRPMPGVH